MFDSHCHLNHPRLARELDDVLTRAREAGVSGFLVPGYDLPSSRRAVETASNEIFAAVGVHPHDADKLDGPTRSALESLAAAPQVSAVGETGLDLHRKPSANAARSPLSPPAAQLDALAFHADLAARTRKPLILHTRDAFDELFAALPENLPAVVLHCFSGGDRDLVRAVERGYYVSFSGTVTYGTWTLSLDGLPLSRVLVETDAPYLPPLSRRGERNEPAFITETARALAERLGLGLDELERLTDENARALTGAA